MGLEKREMPVNGPRMAQKREKVLSGIYIHGWQKATKTAVFRDVPLQEPKMDNSQQFWTICTTSPKHLGESLSVQGLPMIFHSAPAGEIHSIGYIYDMANRRTQMNLPDGTGWRYGYDRLSQVVSGTRVDAQDAPVSGQSYRYAYDGIGNRTSAQEGSSANLRRYGSNALNQYITVFSPGVIPIRGRADADARVAVTTTIGGTSATYMPERSGQDFSIDIPVDNSSGAVTAAVQVDALRHDGTLDIDLHRRLSGDYTVPAAVPEVPAYDLDGNLLTYDGWTCAWNAQDRLVSATKGDTRLEFNYDYLGRRFEKKVYESNALVKHQLFVYDGFKQIEKRGQSPDLSVVL